MPPPACPSAPQKSHFFLIANNSLQRGEGRKFPSCPHLCRDKEMSLNKTKQTNPEAKRKITLSRIINPGEGYLQAELPSALELQSIRRADSHKGRQRPWKNALIRIWAAFSPDVHLSMEEGWGGGEKGFKLIFTTRKELVIHTIWGATSFEPPLLPPAPHARSQAGTLRPERVLPLPLPFLHAPNTL